MNHRFLVQTGVALCSVFTLLNSSFAQGTAFTYQGRLNDGANPANGTYDLRFTLFDSTNLPGTIVAGPFTNAATGVTDGLFTVVLDFGTVFDGSNRWLELAARTNLGGAGSFIESASKNYLDTLRCALRQCRPRFRRHRRRHHLRHVRAGSGLFPRYTERFQPGGFARG